MTPNHAINGVIIAILISIISCQESNSDQMSTKCPQSWHRYENKCLFVNLTAVHSKDNEIFCQSINSTMVTINTAEENEFIRRLIFIHYESHKWIWLSRARNYNASSNVFFWKSNEGGVNYTNWVTPDGSVDCNVCCEIALMTSGHWFPSHCNSWTFIQMCQRSLPSSAVSGHDLFDDRTASAFSGNFYLSQFSKTPAQGQDQNPDSNLSELFDFLFYELEGIKNDINSVANYSVSGNVYEDALVSRDAYLLTLLSLTISLLLIIMIGVAFSYYLIVQRLNSMDCLVRN